MDTDTRANQYQLATAADKHEDVSQNNRDGHAGILLSSNGQEVNMTVRLVLDTSS